MLVSIIKKYGICPKSAMPETYQSSHTHDYELEFWQEARKSPYYEIILKTNGDFNRLNYKGPQSVSKFRKYVDTHMPVGTARRKVLDTILPRDSHRFNVLKVWYHKIGIWVD